MIRLLALALTCIRFASGLFYMASPRLWLTRRLNPFSQTLVFESLVDAMWFRIDMIAQNMIGRPLGRERWVQAIARSCAEPPEKPVEPGSVPEMEWGPDALEQFKSGPAATQTPVVVRGLLRGASDLGDWDFESFIKTYADDVVTLTCPVGDGYLGKVQELDIPGVYLQNSEILLHRHPELMKKSGFGHLAETLAKGMTFSGIFQLFAGRKNTGTWWHCAGGMNLFMMLDGRKKWSFIDPAESPWLFPRTSGPGRSTYYMSDNGRASPSFHHWAEVLGVEVGEAESTMANAFARCKRIEVILEPGDVLFVPPYWWHDIENLTPHTIAMATRWFYTNDPQLSNPVFELGNRLNPRFFFRMAHTMLTQRLVDWSGVVHFDSLGTEEGQNLGKITDMSRSSTLTGYLDVEPDVAAYYRKHGAEMMAQP